MKNTFSVVYDANLKLCIFRMASIWGRAKLFLPEVQYTSKIAMCISNILSDVIAEILQENGSSKFGVIFGPEDVINHVMNMNLCTYSHNPMIHLYSWFDDDVLDGF